MAAGAEQNSGLKNKFIGAVARQAIRHTSPEMRVMLGREALRQVGMEPTNHTERTFFKPEIANLAEGEARIILRYVQQFHPDKFPKTIAIIPDGNGRFEEAHKELPEGEGYVMGARALKEGIESFEEFKDQIDNIFLWGWSDDNEQRNPRQKQLTQGIIKKYLELYTPELKEKGFKIRHVGKTENFIDGLGEVIKTSEEATKENKGTNILIGIDYGERSIEAERAKRLRQPVVVNEDPETGYVDLSYGELSENEIRQIEIESMGMPFAGLIFRTAGEQRLSGFLPGVFSEMVITPKNMPELTVDDLDKMLLEGICRRVTYGRSRPDSKYSDGSIAPEIFHGQDLSVAFANILNEYKREKGEGKA